MRRKRGRPAVEDGPITLVVPASFETEIETTTVATGPTTIEGPLDVGMVSSDVTNPSSPLGQVRYGR